MACRAFEDKILDYVEGAVSEKERGALEAHLRSCAPCHGFMETQRKLDASLRAAYALPPLPADFKARVMSKAFSEPAAAPVKSVGLPWVADMLNVLAWGGAAAAAVVAVFQLSPSLSEISIAVPSFSLLMAANVLGAAALAFGVWCARREVRRLHVGFKFL